MSRIVSITKSAVGSLGDLLSGRYSTPEPSPLVGGPAGGVSTAGDPKLTPWFNTVQVPMDRVREMQYYDFLETNISDVPRALDAFATMAVTGDLSGGGTRTYAVRMVNPPDEYPEELKARFRRLETIIRESSFQTVRAMCKYGSFMPENVLAMMADNRLGVAHLRPIPPATIFRNFDSTGRWTPEAYWAQQITQTSPPSNGVRLQLDAKAKTFPIWRMPHFALWSNGGVSATETLLYGRSILKPFGAIGLKVHGVLDSMVLARLTRAAMRYRWKVDVSDLKGDPKQIMKRLAMWKQSVTRSTTGIGSAQDSYKKPPTPDEDFFIASGEGLAYDLDTIDGDTNLARVQDVELLFRVYFGALGVPPEYLGHERSQGGRSNLSQIDINFARTARHIQMYGAAGYQHMVWVDMLAGGYDPLKYPVEIISPQIGARDDLLQAQIRALQAGVILTLRQAGMKLEKHPRWVLSTFLNMSDELEGLDEGELADLFDDMQIEGGEKPKGVGRRAVESVLAQLHSEIGPLVRENILALLGQKSPEIQLALSSSLETLDMLRSGMFEVGR